MSADPRLPPHVLRALRALSPFTRAVLLACARIPAGSVMTYGQLAAAIGRPGAARAVGNALARNPFAPLVPCHRVVRSDGSLGGYSAPGGHARKRVLLRRERCPGV